MKKQIAIISPSSAHLSRELLEAGRDLAPDRMSSLELSIGGPVSCSLGQDRLEIGRQSLLDCSKIFIHGFEYMDPIVPGEAGISDWSVWQQNHIAEQQRFSILYSIFAEAERRGVRVYNPMHGLVLCFQVSELLARLRSSGFLVPATLVTNDRAEAADFRGRYETVIWRPTTGRAAWQLFGDIQNEHLIDVRKPPVLMAEAVDGPACWSYVLDNQVLLSHDMLSPEIYPPESLELVRVLPSGPATPIVADVCRVADLRWARVMYVHNDAGVWIYGIEADPLMYWLPRPLRQHLTRSLARALLGMPQEGIPDSLRDGNFERPALFLRRMLTILFEIEATKSQAAKTGGKGER